MPLNKKPIKKIAFISGIALVVMIALFLLFYYVLTPAAAMWDHQKTIDDENSKLTDHYEPLIDRIIEQDDQINSIRVAGYPPNSCQFIIILKDSAETSAYKKLESVTFILELIEQEKNAIYQEQVERVGDPNLVLREIDVDFYHASEENFVADYVYRYQEGTWELFSIH